MRQEKKHPLIVRKPIFTIYANGETVLTDNIQKAITEQEGESAVFMNARLVEGLGPFQGENTWIVKSTKIETIQFMPLSKCWKVITQEETYHIVNW